MPISFYIKGLREKVGHAPLLTPGADALVHDADGALLLLRRRDDGLWGIPGGQVDPLEPPALGVVREVLEETGLLVRPVELLGVFGGVDDFHIRYPNGDELDPIVSLFRCEIVSGELRALDSEAFSRPTPCRVRLHPSRAVCWNTLRRGEASPGTRDG